MTDKEESSPAVPNTGIGTGGDADATFITTSIFGIMLGALIVALLPHFTHKKLGFDK